MRDSEVPLMIGNSKTRLEQWDQIVVSAVAVIWCLFQIVTGLMPMEIIFQRAIHITFALVLVFLMFSFAGKKQDRISLHGWVLAAIVVMISVYVLNTWEGRAEQIGQAPPIHEIIMGVALIVLSLDAARRTTGWALPIFTIAIIFYSLFGENLPWIFAHRKYDLERIVTSLFLTYDGIYGGLTGISATFLFLFMVFGTFLRISGAGEFFIDLASSLFGHVRGGSAKISIVASSLFGMITGSVVANVSAIGQITIPMMKKGGYRPEFAGAVEACSGLGSQIMPPVMGGSVFIMVELLQTPYFSICKAAFITACLFYLCIFMMVDLEAVKYNLKGVPKEQRKEFWKVFKGGYHFFIPIGVLVYLLGVVHYSESRAVFWAIIAVPICSYFRESSRMGIDKIYMALKEGAQICLTIVPIIINCSIISALIVLTGLGLNISDMLIQLAGGSLIGLLILTSIASLIIGTGMPIIVSYILLAILVSFRRLAMISAAFSIDNPFSFMNLYDSSTNSPVPCGDPVTDPKLRIPAAIPERGEAGLPVATNRAAGTAAFMKKWSTIPLKTAFIILSSFSVGSFPFKTRKRIPPYERLPISSSRRYPRIRISPGPTYPTSVFKQSPFSSIPNLPSEISAQSLSFFSSRGRAFSDHKRRLARNDQRSRLIYNFHFPDNNSCILPLGVFLLGDFQLQGYGVTHPYGQMKFPFVP